MSDRLPCKHLTQSPEAYHGDGSPDGWQRAHQLLCAWPTSQATETWPTWMTKRVGGGSALHPGAPECAGCPAYSPRSALDD